MVACGTGDAVLLILDGVDFPNELLLSRLDSLCSEGVPPQLGPVEGGRGGGADWSAVQWVQCGGQRRERGVRVVTERPAISRIGQRCDGPARNFMTGKDISINSGVRGVVGWGGHERGGSPTSRYAGRSESE